MLRGMESTNEQHPTGKDRILFILSDKSACLPSTTPFSRILATVYSSMANSTDVEFFCAVALRHESLYYGLFKSLHVLSCIISWDMIPTSTSLDCV